MLFESSLEIIHRKFLLDQRDSKLVPINALFLFLEFVPNYSAFYLRHQNALKALDNTILRKSYSSLIESHVVFLCPKVTPHECLMNEWSCPLLLHSYCVLTISWVWLEVDVTCLLFLWHIIPHPNPHWKFWWLLTPITHFFLQLLYRVLVRSKRWTRGGSNPGICDILTNSAPYCATGKQKLNSLLANLPPCWANPNSFT